MLNIAETVSTSIHHQYDLAYIRKLFTCVASHATADSLFTSEMWLSAWLSTLDCMPNLAVFSLSHDVIGFAFIGKQKSWYGDTYYLNQTGIAEFDQMWIEHNDIICDASRLAACRESLLTALSKTKHFHRLVVSLSPSQQWGSENTFTWSKSIDEVAYVNTSLIAKSDDGMAKLLSKNARSTINRAHNYIHKQLGKITFHLVKDNIKTLNEGVAPLHITQWQSTPSGSGFSNPHFINFHQRLCDSNDGHNHVEILHFRAGEHDLGYLYLIISGKTVYFYLSAINYEDPDNRYKPGLVMHKLAIEHYAKLGYERYDFLAGYARYKESLSTDHYPLYTLHIANRALKHRILYRINRALSRFKEPNNLYE